jgi:hypothetical protein
MLIECAAQLSDLNAVLSKGNSMRISLAGYLLDSPNPNPLCYTPTRPLHLSLPIGAW